MIFKSLNFNFCFKKLYYSAVAKLFALAIDADVYSYKCIRNWTPKKYLTFHLSILNVNIYDINQKYLIKLKLCSLSTIIFALIMYIFFKI